LHILDLWFTLQEEYDDEDDWNPSKAAGVCLMLLATCCEDDIVPYVLPFVKDNIKSADWRFRDAALMAFGKTWLLALVFIRQRRGWSNFFLPLSKE
jgi:hypothetical protein